jgi:hypothetical protein
MPNLVSADFFLVPTITFRLLFVSEKDAPVPDTVLPLELG